MLIEKKPKMVPTLKACILLLLSTSVTAESEVYSSTAEMEIFVKTQGRLLKTLQEYYDGERGKFYLMEKYLNESQEELKQIQNSDKYFENPIHVYQFIKRLSKDLKHIENMIVKKHDFVKDSTVRYPTKNDLSGIIYGLIRLQNVYQLNVSDLAKGILKGNFSADNQPYLEQVTRLSDTDCYLLSNYAGEILGPEQKVAWLMEILEIISACQNCLDETMEVVDRIWKEYYEIGNVNKTIHWLRKRMSLNPKDPNALKYYATVMYLQENPESLANLKTRKDQKMVTKPIQAHATNLTDEQKKMFVEDDIYKALCRGEQHKIGHGLTCHYQTGSHPFLRLARVKTELLHRSPDLILYRDVISDAEIQHVQEIARPTMKRVGCVNVTKTEKRVVKSAFLTDEKYSVAAKISRRLSQITNLSVESAEELHISNYGVGGYFTPHHDFYGKEYPHYVGAERIGSILAYLSDVEQGGATVFTHAKVTVFPEKGAALFWWNLHRSGESDYKTVHAGCPVLRGSKWIASKWFHVEGQELIRLCLPKRKSE